MQFEFATATRIIFGCGAVKDIGKIAGEMGKRALLVTGKSSERADFLRDLLKGIEIQTITIEREPTIPMIETAVKQAAGCDLVIGMGGGSVLDGGKAIAALLANPGNVLDYLEVIGQGKPLQHAPLPYIAIPTTAGTGSEVTRNAVLDSPEHHLKVSLRSPSMLPQLALIDPELAISVPPAITASTGMDALTQLIEPFVCNRTNPLTDALCREGMARVARSLRRACENGNDLEAREDMALAALFSGMALANARLGAVHGFAGPFGGIFNAPHGAICAALLPHVTAINLQHIGDVSRYEECARILTGKSDDLVKWLEQLSRDLQIPPLSSYGLTPQHYPELIEKASKASSMQGNPVKLSAEALQAILEREAAFA